MLRSAFTGAAFAVVSLAAQAAWAVEPGLPIGPSPEAPGAAPAVVTSVAELAEMSGRANDTIKTTVALTEQDLNAVNSGNRITAGEVNTGAITMRDNAFADFNGVGNIIMNTGNNNNIQSSMSVTVVITH